MSLLVKITVQINPPVLVPSVVSPPPPPAEVSAMIKISTGSLSNEPSLILPDLSTTYRKYLLVFDNLLAATDNVLFVMQTSTNNGTSFATSGYSGFQLQAQKPGGGQPDMFWLTNEAHIRVCGEMTNTAGKEFCGTLDIYNPAFAGAKTQITMDTSGLSFGDSPALSHQFNNYHRTTAEANNAIKFFCTSGNIATMNYTFYGLTA